MTKKICISGYYGFDNFGDEAILKILIDNLKKGNQDIFINVFSVNPEKTKAVHNVESTYTFDIKKITKELKNADCLISGGGSLLQDITSIKSLIYYLYVITVSLLFKKKVIIFAQGIGPINNIFLRQVTMYLLKKCTYITVRDEKSFNMLKQNGINAVLCSDPVWNISKTPKEKNSVTGVQLRAYKYLTPEFINILAQNINKYFNNKEIYILSLQNSMDLKPCEMLKESLLKINQNLKITIYENDSINNTIQMISNLDELIAMRYHACLSAIKNDVKLLPINYDIKVEEIAKEYNLASINFENYKSSMEETFAKFIKSDIKYNENKINEKRFNFEELNNNL